jgi:hypothetical protein
VVCQPGCICIQKTNVSKDTLQNGVIPVK